MLMRVWFQKAGKLKYISHLDLNRTMLRAVSRSGLPLWYTQGFNRHPFITFALPLSLGVASRCEIIDIRLETEAEPSQVVSSLNSVLPPELQVFKAAEAVQGVGQIGYAAYEINFNGPESVQRQFAEFWAKPEILVFKKSKSGGKEVDLRQLAEIGSVVYENEHLTVSVILPSGSDESVNPNLLTSNFIEFANDDRIGVSITRTAVYDKSKKDFA